MNDSYFFRHKLAETCGVLLVAVIFCILQSVFFVCKAFASDTLRLSLDQALQQALSQSPNIRLARLDSLTTEARWRTVRAGMLPQLSLSGDVPNLMESVNEAFFLDAETGMERLRNYKSGDQRWQGRLTLGQDLPWGASLNLSTRLYRRWWFWTPDSVRESFTEYSLLNRAMFVQPLLAGNPVGREYRTGKIDRKRGLIDYDLKRKDLIYQTKTAFFGLVSAMGALEISEQDLVQGRESEVLAKRKLQAGLIPEVELLQIQVDLARREGGYRQSRDQVQSAQDNLRLLLGIPFDRIIEPRFEPEKTIPNLDEDRYLTGQRNELTQAELNLKRTELQTRASMLLERVQASLQLYYEVDTRREEFADLDDRGDRNVGVTLHFDLPLFGFGSTGGEVEALRTQLRRERVRLETTRDRLVLELREALRSVEQAAYRIQIAEAAVTLSEQSYQITLERFDNGAIDSRDLIDAELELTRTRREALNARMDYELAIAYLDKIMPIPEE